MTNPPLVGGPDRQREGVRHVMHLVPRYINDGTCRVVNSIIKYTDRSRYMTFVGILSRDTASLQPLVDMGALPIQFDMKRFFDVSVLAALVRALKANQIQILHTHRIRPDIMGRIAGALAGVPVNVSTQHHVGEWDERGPAVGRLVRFLYKCTLPLTQEIVCISDGERRATIKAGGVPADKLKVIHNGVDGEVFFPEISASRAGVVSDAGRPVVIGCVAYLTKRKGIDHLIAAFRQVAGRFPSARLTIVGDGEERESLQAQITALGMEGTITLLGNRTDVPALMNSFDIFVLPSIWEAFGLVIAEAMACGKPVVATNVGGIPEIVEHGRTGLLVPAAAVAPLADALTVLLKDGRLRAQFGQAGRQRFLERFDSRIMAGRYQALYDSLP